jgi:hypothetical protein
MSTSNCHFFSGPVDVGCKILLNVGTYQCVERDSSVGIATGYGLDGPGIESRWGARFFAHVQTGPGAHPASCTMGTESFRGEGGKAAEAWC